MSENNQIKKCIKCGLEKNVSEFYFRKDANNYRNSCKDCISKYNKQFSDKNKAYYSKHNKEYRLKNRDALIAYSKKYYYDNFEKIAKKAKENYPNIKQERQSYFKEYYQKNKDYIIVKNKEWANNNKDKIKEYKKEWSKTEKGIICKKRSKANRRVKEGKKISSQDTRDFLNNSDKKCYWCGSKININNSQSYHLDHYIPLAKGGENSINNIVLSCPTCNLSKGAKDPIKFANSIGRLL